MNEIKNIVLKTNNFLIIALFVIVLCFSGITVMSGAVWQGIVFLIAGVLVASLLSGYYILIHSILIENEKQSKLLENILSELKKEIKK
jgi:small-conductance mechanosensitive channel